MRNKLIIRTTAIIKYALTMVVLISFAACKQNKASKEKPVNIIFLMTDDQRWDNMGCYGRPEFNTPNVDNLAAEGVVFDQAFYAVSICMPSRATMMTGRYNSNHKVGFVAPENYSLSKADYMHSYPAMLKQAGYRTGFIGKFGFEVSDTARLPNRQDMDFKKQLGDVFDYFAGSDTREDKGLAYWAENNTPLDSIYRNGRTNSTRTLRTGEAMLNFIETQPKEEPFCLSVSFYAVKHNSDSHVYWPHYEQFAEKEFSVPGTWVEDNTDKLPEVVVKNARGVYLHKKRSSTPEKYQTLVKRFATQGYTVDQQVGLLMEKLKERNMLDNTVIIYTSDNGRFQGSHGLSDKCLLYEESIREPLIVFDGRVPEDERGRREDALVSSVDIAPTILSFANIKPSPKMQGKSIKPILDGTQDMTKWRDAVFFEDLFIQEIFGQRKNNNGEEVNKRVIEGNRSYRSRGVRTKRYKYFVYYECKPKVEELYDLDNDPMEQTNLANNAEYKDVLLKLRAKTDQMYKEALGE